MLEFIIRFWKGCHEVKKKYLTTILCFYIICLTCNWRSINAHENKEKSIYKENKSIQSYAHTIYLKDQKDDEVSIYFSTLETLQEGSQKITEIVIHLYEEFKKMGYREITSSHPVPPRYTISIDIIQQADGIMIVLGRDNREIWKLFVIENPKEIANEILFKLQEIEV